MIKLFPGNQFVQESVKQIYQNTVETLNALPSKWEEFLDHIKSLQTQILEAVASAKEQFTSELSKLIHR
jgi:hypothetical protein